MLHVSFLSFITTLSDVKICHHLFKSCTKFSENWLWSANYRWLMIMETNSTRNIKRFLKSKRMNLTVNSEVLLAYPGEINGVINKWHIFDIYRTAFEPRGLLIIDTVNKTLKKWGNRSWKFDKRSNLENLTINTVMIVRTWFFFLLEIF